MPNKTTVALLWLFVTIIVLARIASAQIPPELIGYPDGVLYHGKIATFDGPLMSEQLGLRPVTNVAQWRIEHFWRLMVWACLV